MGVNIFHEKYTYIENIDKTNKIFMMLLGRKKGKTNNVLKQIII